MKRLVDLYLSDWRRNPDRKPLLLRGARQVGKTYAVRNLGVSFERFIEINFEQQPKVASVFEPDLNAQRIIRDLEILFQKPIVPGKSLLFFDEIQAAPKAIGALRYLHEQIPGLHVIAAGSLLEFQLQSTGLPVGRIQSLFMYPVSFLEFLAARGETAVIRFFSETKKAFSVSTSVHAKLLALWGEYMAVGGMPEAIRLWCERRSFDAVSVVLRSIMETYRQDFEKYAKGGRARYLPLIFERTPWLQGRKFKFTHVSDSLKKRELAPALDLLVKAGIVHKVIHSAAQGIPLGAQADPDRFKLLFIDVGLGQTMLGPGQGGWIIDPVNACVNKGGCAEAFTGQELLAYADSDMRSALFYWLREARSSNAEVDYVATLDGKVIPIEIKSGATGSLKSLHLFLAEHPASTCGIRLFAGMPEIKGPVCSYPLYCTPLLFLKPQMLSEVINAL
ncbi:MAG: ATP-binding protein [Chitinispirillaceae bacterium]|nr:ATP-binding protein [Chitinispirillaceae bacterium]